MTRKTILIKLLVALSALGVSIRLNIPVYSVSIAFANKGVAIKIARVVPDEPRPAPDSAASSSSSQKPPEVREEGMTQKSTPSHNDGGAPKAQAPEAEPANATAKPEARVEFMNIAPEGTSVLAGRATPGAQVKVSENGQEVGTAVAGADGDWSLATEHRFASKTPSASLNVEAYMVPPANHAKSQATAPPLQPPVADAAATAPPSGPAADLIKDFAAAVEVARREAEAQPQTQSAAQTPDIAAAPNQTAPTVEMDTAAREGPAPPALISATGESAKPAKSAERAASSVVPAPSAAPPQSAAVGNMASIAPQRAPAPLVIPIPMQFVYREATLTSDGEKAVALLSEYLKLKKYDAVTLSGHADERGGGDFNMELSRQRLEVIVSRLREGGFKGAVNLEPKGENEPFTAVDRARFGREDLFQLDRRVELRVAR